MAVSIHGVFCGGRPSKMFRVHTAEVAVATGVRRFGTIKGGRPLNNLAHAPMRVAGRTIKKCFPISFGPRKRPQQALFPVVIRIREKPLFRLTIGRVRALPYVLMPDPSHIMSMAPSTRFMWIAAALDCAYFGLSHSTLHRRFG